MVNQTADVVIGQVGKVGEGVSGFMTGVIQFLSKLGLNLSTEQGKLLNMIIVIALLYICARFVEKPLKYLLMGLLGLLIISIGLSFANI